MEHESAIKKFKDPAIQLLTYLVHETSEDYNNSK